MSWLQTAWYRAGWSDELIEGAALARTMQQARMGTDDLWSLKPIVLPVDAGAVRARRKLDRPIRAEQGGAAAHA